MSEKIIRRNVGTVDERLPLKQVIEESRKQAAAMPLEITEDGIVYEVFDCKMQIDGYMNTTIALYRPKGSSHGNLKEK